MLNGFSFRAVGFTEPLTVTCSPGTLDFPTRIDWDTFFASSSRYNEKKFGERPDTVYIGGLPFEWFKVKKKLIFFFKFFLYFKNTINASFEDTFKQIFSEYGIVNRIDIPQLDPLRKQMEEDITGIRLSSWSFGQVFFFLS